LKDELLAAVDLDARAFNKVMESVRLPKGTEEQARERDKAVEEASKEATLVPYGVLEAAVELIGLAEVVVREGNRNSVSDAGVAGLAALAAGKGAYFNVRINLPGIKDVDFKARIGEGADALRDALVRSSDSLEAMMETALKGA
jgi:glutamate formiminotransferase/formiminotetrahydrofolate cyclodeaminase